MRITLKDNLASLITPSSELIFFIILAALVYVIFKDISNIKKKCCFKFTKSISAWVSAVLLAITICIIITNTIVNDAFLGSLLDEFAIYWFTDNAFGNFIISVVVLGFPSYILFYILITIPHEYIHKIIGESFGLHMKIQGAKCICTDKMNAKEVFYIALAPCFIINLIFGLVLLFSGGIIAKILLWLILSHTLCCIGDFWFAVISILNRKSSFYLDGKASLRW